MCSWGVATLLGMLSTRIYSILLPFVAMAGGFIIILCPWPFLTVKNMLLLIFYLIVAAPLSLKYSGRFDNNDYTPQQDLGHFFVPGLIGTCSVGAFVALLVHLITVPTSKSTTCTRQSKDTIKQLSYETHKLLQSIVEYTNHIGKSSTRARQARTLIEFYVNRRQQTLTKLESMLPAMKAEKQMPKSELDTLEVFLSCSKKQQTHAELIKLATTQMNLGEEFTSQNDTVREVKTKLSMNLGFALEQLTLEYERSEKAFFDNSTNANQRNKDIIFGSLKSCIEDYRKAMRQAITDAETLLLERDAESRSTASTAGPLIRQRVAFLGTYSLVDELLQMVTNKNDKQPSDKQPSDKESTKSKMSQLVDTLKMPWPWKKDVSKRRLAAKTGLGLLLGSLWVAIPYLREAIAYPNSIWVGMTAAVVSLETTGATFAKAVDRLWGTLVAGGYAMLINKLFDGSHWAVKLFALSIFVFTATFLTNRERPYASRYASASVVSILYGSFDNGIDAVDYAGMRVMLIFTGVVLFLFVEVLVFPRSSRTVVQASSLQFFEDLEHFFYDSGRICGSISAITRTKNGGEDKVHLPEDDPMWLLREGYDKFPSLANELDSTRDVVSKTLGIAKGELRPGLQEPSLGVNIALDSAGYNNLLAEQSKIVSQLDLLIRSIKSLIGYYSNLNDNNRVRNLYWPTLLSTCLVDMAQQLSKCGDNLRAVFPNGLLRPGSCDIEQTIRAIAVFRNFEDLVLDTLNIVAERHSSYLDTLNTSGEKVGYAPGFRLTLSLAISSILTVGHSLSLCGQHLEGIIQQSFPDDEFQNGVTSSQTQPTIPLGNSSIINGSGRQSDFEENRH